MGLISNIKNDRVRYWFDHDSFEKTIFLDEPIGFKEDEVEYARHNKYHGIFTLFSQNLEFYGASRSVIKTFFDSFGINGKLRMGKDNKEQDISQTNTMLWVNEWEGFLDFKTFKLSETKATCNFDSSGMSELLNSREGIEVEIEREDTIDGTTINTISRNDIILTPRSILAVDQSVINGEQIYISPNLGSGATIGKTPLTTLVSKQHVLFSDVTDSQLLADPNAENFFWILNTEASTDLNVAVDIEGIFTESGFGAVSFKVYRYHWNGSTYDLIQTYSLGGLPPTSVLSSLISNVDINLEVDDNLALVVELTNATLQLKKFNITVSEETTFEVTNPINKFVFVYDLLDTVSTVITNKTFSFFSNYFGRTVNLDKDGNSQYSINGVGSFTGFISGFQIRNFLKGADRYKSPKISFKDIVSSLDAVFNIGLGVEKVDDVERIRIEDKKYFYQNVVTIVLGEVENLETEVFTDLYFNELSFGYSKSGGYEEEMGLDEPNIKNVYSTILEINNKYEKTSKVRADGYGKEFARRKPQDQFPTEDTRYDDDNWFLDVKDETPFTEKLWQDRFEVEPTGIFKPENATGLYYSPMNMLKRHEWSFSSGLEKDLDKSVIFASSNGNSDLKTQLIGEEERAERGSILNYDLERPRLLGELITFEHNVTSAISKSLKGTTLIGGEQVPNIYGIIEFKYKGEIQHGYLKSVKPSGKEWTLIKYNTRVRRAEQIIDFVDFSAEIFTGSTVQGTLIDTSVNNEPVIGTLSFVSKTDTTIDISWTAAVDPDSNLDGYRVYYKLSNSGIWILFSTEGSGASTKTVTGLLESNEYDLSIIAFDSGAPVLDSLRSNIITQTTSDLTAPVIGTLSTSTPTSTTMPLKWTTATDAVGVTGYNVLYKKSSDGSFTLIDTLSTLLKYTVTGLDTETSYDFKIQAYDAVPNTSSDSNIVTNSTFTWFSFSATDGNTTSNNACASSQPNTYWAQKAVVDLIVTDKIYTSPDVLDTLNGGNNWYKLGVDDSYRINSSGEITEITTCTI